jgi:hypothetical protein
VPARYSSLVFRAVLSRAREARRAVPIWHGESFLRSKHDLQNIFASFFFIRDMKYINILCVLF